MAVDLTHYLTGAQAARKLGVKRGTVTAMIASGRLVPTIMTPLGRLFARGEVDRVKKLRKYVKEL